MTMHDRPRLSGLLTGNRAAPAEHWVRVDSIRGDQLTAPGGPRFWPAEWTIVCTASEGAACRARPDDPWEDTGTCQAITQWSQGWERFCDDTDGPRHAGPIDVRCTPDGRWVWKHTTTRWSERP